MNRQTKQLLALAGVLAVGLGAYAALRVWNAGEEEREAAQADYVLQLSDVTALSFDSGDGPLSFTLEETGWTWDGDSEFPVNGTELDALREDLTALKAERIIPEPDALADYGLEEPAYTLTARTGSGESTTLLLGSLDPGGSHRYAMLDGGTEVYTVDGSITSSLDSELLDLMELPQLPDLDEKNITSAQLELTDGTVRQLTSAVETRETEVETETGETDENGEPIYETTTETEEITLWSLDGQPLPEGAVGLEDWLYDLSTLYLDSCSAFKADQEELYDGLDAVSDDLEDVEDAVFGEDDEDEEDVYEYEEPEEDEDCYATTCPTCEETIYFDESVLEDGEVICPNCGEKLEFDMSSLEEDEEDSDDDQE